VRRRDFPPDPEGFVEASVSLTPSMRFNERRDLVGTSVFFEVQVKYDSWNRFPGRGQRKPGADPRAEFHFAGLRDGSQRFFVGNSIGLQITEKIGRATHPGVEGEKGESSTITWNWTGSRNDLTIDVATNTFFIKPDVVNIGLEYIDKKTGKKTTSGNLVIEWKAEGIRFNAPGEMIGGKAYIRAEQEPAQKNVLPKR
jgi:hypothetical protein